MTRVGGEPDYYETLMVPEGATEEQIRAQYRRLAAVLHPDTNPQRRDLAEERMKLLNEARDVLLDPARRAEYDACRRAAREAAEEAPGGAEEGLSAEGGPEPAWEPARAERPRASAWRRVRDALPLTGVWGPGGYFWLVRIAWAVASAFGPLGILFGSPLLVLALVFDAAHALFTFVVFSWWLGENPLLTYPLAGLLAWCERWYEMYGSGAGPWWFVPMFGIGLAGRALTLPGYLGALAALGRRRAPA
ncbi:MAG: J domain-containing protein [Bacillota bacterium]